MEEEGLFDQETGQPLFQPRLIAKSNRGLHRNLDKNEAGGLGNYLYSQKDKMDEKMNQKKRMALQEKQAKVNTVFTKDNSNRIVEKVKITKFSQLFKFLDSDQDGYISA